MNRFPIQFRDTGGIDRSATIRALCSLTPLISSNGKFEKPKHSATKVCTKSDERYIITLNYYLVLYAVIYNTEFNFE